MIGIDLGLCLFIILHLFICKPLHINQSINQEIFNMAKIAISPVLLKHATSLLCIGAQH